jgi:hypothetical protein
MGPSRYVVPRATRARRAPTAASIGASRCATWETRCCAWMRACSCRGRGASDWRSERSRGARFQAASGGGEGPSVARSSQVRHWGAPIPAHREPSQFAQRPRPCHVKRCCARAIAGGVFDGLALTTARAPKPLSSSSRLPSHHIASRGGAIVTTARQRRHTFSQLPRRGHNRCPCSLVTRASPTHLQRMNRPQPPPSVPQNLRLFQHRQE